MNQTIMSIVYRLMLLVSCASLFGCGQDTEFAYPHKYDLRAKEFKPGAAIQLLSDSLLTIDASQEVQVKVHLSSPKIGEEMAVDFSTTPGLMLVATQLHQDIGFSTAASIEIPVRLLAKANGRYYLKMRIELHDGAIVSYRNLAVIVQVGPVADKAAKLHKSAEQNVIVLPAQETISSP